MQITARVRENENPSRFFCSGLRLFFCRWTRLQYLTRQKTEFLGLWCITRIPTQDAKFSDVRKGSACRTDRVNKLNMCIFRVLHVFLLKFLASFETVGPRANVCPKRRRTLATRRHAAEKKRETPCKEITFFCFDGVDIVAPSRPPSVVQTTPSLARSR